MALAKSITQSSGITLTYWRIMSIGFNRSGGVTTCTVSGYLDKAAADAGRTPGHSFQCTWSNVLTKESLTDGTAMAKCYAKLKQAAPTTGIMEAHPVAINLSNPLAGASDA